MGLFKNFVTKATQAFSNMIPNKLYSSFSGAFGLTTFSFSRRSMENFIQKGYIENPEVNSVVNRIARKAAATPLKVMRLMPDGKIEEDKTHPINDLLKCPNPLQTRQEWLEEAFIYILVTGNNYINGVTDEMPEILANDPASFEAFQELGTFSGGIIEVTNLPSQLVDIVKGNAVQPVAGYVLNGRKREKFEEAEVLHLKYADPSEKGKDSHVGLSPLSAAMFPYETSNNQWKANATILKNRGAMGIVSNNSSGIADVFDAKEAKKNYKENWQIDDIGIPWFTDADITYTQIGMSPQDLQLLDNNVMTLRAICNVLQTNSALFNDPANKTFNNVKEAEKSFWNDAVIPLQDKYEQGLTNWLVPSFNDDIDEVFLQFDRSKVPALQEDKETLFKSIALIVEKGLITINEGRQMLGKEDATPEQLKELLERVKTFAASRGNNNNGEQQ